MIMMRRGPGGSQARIVASVCLLLAIVTGGGRLAGQDAPAPGAFDVQITAEQGDFPVGSLFIQNLDSIWTAAGSVIAGGSILIEDGAITAVGTDVEPPEGVRVLEGRGLTAIPGIVDEHSHTAMLAVNEGTGAVVPEVRVMDVLDPEDFNIYRALSGGVTTARIMHGSANPIGGQSAVIKMRWGVEGSRQLLLPEAPRFVKFALGENVTQKNFESRPERFPASRPGVEGTYVQAFTAAFEYAQRWDAYQSNPDAFRVPPRRDHRLDALVDIMAGRIRVHAHSYRADEILMLMDVAERFGFTIDVFTHVLEGYRVADAMAEHGAAAATFSDWWQYKLEAIDAIPYNAALLHRSGVLTAINSDLSRLQPFMVHEMTKPVKYGGVSREDALRMLTLYPARMMHIDDMVGSLEEGKQGDVVLLNGDPFDAYTRVEKTVVDGLVYYDLSDEAGTRDEPFRAGPRLSPGAPVENPDSVTLPPTGREDGGAPTSGPPTGAGADGTALLAGRSFTLVGGTVHPVASPPVEDGVVVVRNGTITAVGEAARVQVPGDLPVLDVSGGHVYPGMLDGLTVLGLWEFGQSPNASDLDETGRYNPHLRAVSGVQMDEPGIAVARANGITSAFIAQQSGIVQGTGGVIQLAGENARESAIEEDAALVVDFPAPRNYWDDESWTLFPAAHDGTREAGPAPWSPGASAFTAMKPSDVLSVPPQETVDSVPDLEGEEMEELVRLFERARLYVDSSTVRDRATEAFWPNREPPDRPLLLGMAPALRGEMRVLFRADTEWQLRTLFLFLDRFPEIRAAVVGGGEAFTVADELAARDIPVILTSSYSPTASRDHSVTATFRNAALLDRAGVTIAFSSDEQAGDGATRNLPYHAARSVAFGLPRAAGIRAVTLSAAEIFGVDDRIGSLEAGKRADLIVTDGDPLQFLTRVQRMWIDGREIDVEDNRHRRLYEEYRGAE